MSPNDSQAYSAGLSLVQWISTGLSVLCFSVGAGEWVFRYPWVITLWLLGNAVLAAVRLSSEPIGPEERMMLKALVWVVGLLSLPLLFWSSVANDDIVFRDANTTIREHQTDSWFGGGPDEEQIETRRYRAKYFLFEEQIGAVESRPAERNKY